MEAKETFPALLSVWLDAVVDLLMANSDLLLLL
jgi:hypothetical protein